MTLAVSQLELPTAPLEGENPLPHFRAPTPDVKVHTVGKLREQDCAGLGKNSAFRVLPYRMQDRYSRLRRLLRLKTIVLQNEFLCATFLPDYGARLYSLFHKKYQRELLFANPVLQLGNLALRNAWFAGGIEWNVSQFGHTFSTSSPLFAAVCRSDNLVAYDFVRFYQFERCREIFWQMDFHLPPQSQTLHAYIKIVNHKDYAEPTYWWSNIAVPETEGVRVFSEDARVLYNLPPTGGKNDTKTAAFAQFGQAELPNLPVLPGKDASYPSYFTHSSEYFFQNDSHPAAPWEAVSYEDGNLFFERSSKRLHYRKMFCWGRHSGGQRWKDFLSQPGQGDYLEIQAGLAPTQLHGIEIPAHTEWDFVQVFGAERSKAPLCQQDWASSRQYVKTLVEKQVSAQQIQHWYEKYKIVGAQPPGELLHSADHWGALELQRSSEKAPTSMRFPPISSNGSQNQEQGDWLHLLEQGVLPEAEKTQSKQQVSWMVSPNWLRLMENSLHKEGGDHWYSRLHLGVACYENGHPEKALCHWRKSLKQRENPLAYRNLGYHYWQTGDLSRARSYYKPIFQLPADQQNLDQAYAEEYLELLLDLQGYAEVWAFYQQYYANQGCSAAPSSPGRLAVLAGRAAVELGQNDYVSALLQTEFAQLREGENWLTDIWFIARAKELAIEQGLEDSPALREQVRKTEIPPARIDFRMR